MGNYAELSLDDGQIAMTSFASDGDLIAATEEGIVINGPEDWLMMDDPQRQDLR